jgi:hypothetical protein
MEASIVMLSRTGFGVYILLLERGRSIGTVGTSLRIDRRHFGSAAKLRSSRLGTGRKFFGVLARQKI